MGRSCFNLLKSHVTHFKYWGPSDISGTGKARIVKSCTQVDCIKSYLLDDKPLLKGVWSGSHDPFSIFTPQLYPRNGWSERRQILCVCTIYQVLALGWQTTPPPNGRGRGHVIRLKIFPNHIRLILRGMGEARHLNFRVLIDTQK